MAASRTGPRSRAAAPAPAGGTVALTAADLAPVDSFLSARNSQWLVGDEVEIVASREYFATALSLTAPSGGYVDKHSGVVGDEEVTTLTFRAPRSEASITTSPRALIGTGVTAMARKRLTVRMRRTTNPDMPVVLNVNATGDASRGVKNAVLERGDVLTIGGTLRRKGKGYEWNSVGGR
jgi:hypothetical protein